MCIFYVIRGHVTVTLKSAVIKKCFKKKKKEEKEKKVPVVFLLCVTHFLLFSS